MKRIICVVFTAFCLLSIPSSVYAQACDTSCSSADECHTKMEKCQEAWSQMEAAKKPHADSLRRMESDIEAFKSKIASIEKELVKKDAAIKVGEKEFDEQLKLTGQRIRSFYMRTSGRNPMVTLLTSSDVGIAFRILGYEAAIVSEDKKIITQTVLMLKDLEDRKTKLESEKVTLSKLKADLDVRAASVKKLVDEATAYQTKLTDTIAALSAKQQSFLAQKLAGLGIPLYAISGGGCSSDLTNGKSPSFSGGFGFFSFGVPNRVGLNQYGAWGRAKAGKGYEEILRAYYNFDSLEKRDAQIRVDGYQTYSLDSYVKRVYEVPDSWADNNLAALKAQAIAVRSYALAYTNNGQGSICTTQQCQVFKPDEKGGNWNRAVDETAGLVMIQGGNAVKAFFSSTHGGYAYNTGDLSGWSQTSYTKRMVDTPSGSVSGFSDLRSTAYDKDSPWFYCDWGGRSSEGGTAWLRPSEVADIVNVYLLAQKDSSAQKHLVQTDKPNPDGVDTWGADTVRDKLGGDAFSTIDNISVSADFGSGKTTSVTFSGSGKTTTINGTDFKTYFNLRAPSNIQIVGPLFNVERR